MNVNPFSYLIEKLKSKADKTELPKTYSINIRLAGATWSLSGSGMYYISGSNAYAVPDATEILSLTIEGWDSMRATDNIIPYISGGTKISLMSNVNTFASADYSSVRIKALYR